MKVKVLKDFKDARTGEIRRKDSFFVAAKERIAEIRKVDASLIEVVLEEKKIDEEKPAKKTSAKSSKKSTKK